MKFIPKVNVVSLLFYVARLKLLKALMLIIDVVIVGFSFILFYDETIKFKELTLITFTVIILYIFALSKCLLTAIKLGILIHDYRTKYFGAELEKNYIDVLQLSLSNDELKSESTMLRIKNNDRVIFSETINDFLMKDEIVIELDDEKYENIKKSIVDKSSVLIPFLIHNYKECRGYKEFYNESKLCLSESISTDSHEVICHKGFYFDSFLTNQSYGRYLTSSADSSVIISDARHYFPIQNNKGNNCLRDITSSVLNNHIGVSALTMTANNYVVLAEQNKKPQKNIKQLVPSGSGSCDFKDYEENNNGSVSLQEVIKYAMKREFEEECSVKHKSKNTEGVLILGYYRNINDSGKPEFVGYIKSNQRYGALRPNHKEISNFIDSGSINNKEDLLTLINEYIDHDRVSTSLYMNLYFLRDFIYKYKDNPELNEILFNV